MDASSSSFRTGAWPRGALHRQAAQSGPVTRSFSWRHRRLLAKHAAIFRPPSILRNVICPLATRGVEDHRTRRVDDEDRHEKYPANWRTRIISTDCWAINSSGVDSLWEEERACSAGQTGGARDESRREASGREVHAVLRKESGLGDGSPRPRANIAPFHQ